MHPTPHDTTPRHTAEIIPFPQRRRCRSEREYARYIDSITALLRLVLSRATAAEIDAAFAYTKELRGRFR